MDSLRYYIIRFGLWLYQLISTNTADAADLFFSYRLLLDRKPDESGWRNYLKILAPGRSRNTLVNFFLNSAEFKMRMGHSSRYICVETEHCSIWVDAEDRFIARSIIATKNYEPGVTAVLQRELASDDIFVDIGANMGWFTLMAAPIVKKVIAVEPNPNNIQLLYRSLTSNHFNNVEVLPYAVSDESKLLKLNFINSNGSVADLAISNDSGVIVQGQPLDKLLQNVDRINVIKMDIEGHEPLAILGMTNTLQRFRPVLVFEFHPLAIRSNTGTDPAAFLESLANMQYQFYVIQDNGIDKGPLSVAGILDEWKKANRTSPSEDSVHLNLVGRPFVEL
ncbi:MAG: FkbM family methyltransferase [Chloroflexota bacterium]|jgi:FkbM family methyltransferase